ncbi:MAG: carbohydrate kinase family protein, partial [Chloroflexi bacterium]|nr:carbohydrate kinase family protein [Chloroflexota bacterium]
TSYSVLGEAAFAASLHAASLLRQLGRDASLDVGLAPMRLASAAVEQLARAVTVLMPSEQVRLEQAAGQWLIRKQGRRGCIVTDSDRHSFPVPAFVVDVVDSTGAGDAFNAGYIVGQMRGLSVRQSALLANTCGAAACTVLGAGGALPTREMVMRLLREHAPGGWEREAQPVLECIESEI